MGHDVVDPKYVKKVRRLSDMIRTLEVLDLGNPEVQVWLDGIMGPSDNMNVPDTLITYLEDISATSAMIQLVCRVFIMLLQQAEDPRCSDTCRARIEEVVSTESRLPNAVFAALKKSDFEATVSLLTLCGVALRFPAGRISFDDKRLAELALDLLDHGESLQVLSDFLVCFAVHTEEENAFELLARHERAPIFGEVLAPMLNQALGVKSSELFDSTADTGMRCRAQVLGLLLEENNSFLYKNDLKVVLEVLTRELPECARQDRLLAEAYVDCLGAVYIACEAGGVPPGDATQVFAEVARDELVPATLRKLCKDTMRRCAATSE